MPPGKASGKPSGKEQPTETKPKGSSAVSSTRGSDGLSPIHAFYVFLAASLFAAFLSPIQDCDEVFNYWEPTHYLNHGYGLQTWEYSPVYAIRSWAYAGIHSLVIYFGGLMPFIKTKTAEFYFLRVTLAFVCAVCETRLFAVISRTLNPRIAIIFLIIMATSTGMFHASAAYLPSTFAMYTTMLGVTAFVGGGSTAQGIMWFGVGTVLGWPFAAALIFPFIAEELLVASVTNDIADTATRFVDGTVRSLVVLALQSAVDVCFYRKALVVPWNIVAYNVFGGSGKGPNIYGTEAWHYYIRNLGLNFNIWLFLALGAAPLVLIQHFVRKQPVSRQSFVRNITFVAPFYLWLAIFSLQPHKEERFMYPAYPLLALNAAMSLHIVLAYVGSSDPKIFFSKIPASLRLAAVIIITIGAIDLGLLRIVGMITAYSAPLKVYAPLQETGVSRFGDNLCLGKEWYRFPSSFFLPDGMHAKFIKSEFSGLLPGEFSEAKVGFGFFPGAWLEPAGMNDVNEEDFGKYTDISHCNFMVDSYFPGSEPSDNEPDYVLDTKNWEPLKCEPFLDHARTGILGRLFWIPDWPIIPEKYRRKWGQYCLLRRKTTI
ncbi:glycosyltransferase family 22 protein [Venturia nashicola]|uniref:Mannosyltransferase n=1 Tax=Venturia nashicola TaxID=86259 RepID=A0A4Z1PGB9_9PEZI|nr:glycosyltransferase family 22 protein [Venturia nashicola]